MKLPQIHLVQDEFIYPRCNVNGATVEAYQTAMEGGAEFPPVEVQCVSGYGDDKEEVWLVLDGVHRWNAIGEVMKWR